MGEGGRRAFSLNRMVRRVLPGRISHQAIREKTFRVKNWMQKLAQAWVWGVPIRVQSVAGVA